MYEATHEFDVCVIGGGMAGMCAAIASARNGAKTVLVHDRAVLGGNASSEVRMWICGAHGKNNKETGILEEIQLENLYRNATRNYSVWDSVLFAAVRFEPNLTPLLSCACTCAQMSGERIASIEAYQTTSQTRHTIHATQFVDCSGDSVLAALTPAAWRSGREARAEFDEDIEPANADAKTMGNSLLIQIRRTEESQPYTPPSWAYKFTKPEDLPNRMRGVNAHNFWWIEVGGLCDTIKDAEEIRDELMKIAYGVWDYIKNYAPERAQAENWALEWVGSLPGKRESRRYEGAHILTQNDVRAGGNFTDTVAYGGWSMDDHHPAGIYYPGQPTIFHAAPSPYGIPFRSLYSRNVPNLLFAGRNISVTHAALSSTRVMGTCAVIGQAAGTAAALCVKNRCAPANLDVHLLQNTLLDDDCFLPGFTRPLSELAQKAMLCSTEGHDAEKVRDGRDRDRPESEHAWTGALGGALEYHWNEAVHLGGVRLTLDSDLSNEKRMAHVYPQKTRAHAVPASLLQGFRLDIRESATGAWNTVHQTTQNYQRLLRIGLPGVRATSIRLVPESTWGAESARVFAFEPLSPNAFVAKETPFPQGISFSARVAQLSAEDLAPPENGLEATEGKARGGAA
ncbi:FAD-dependent oxidoreductase [Armatimonas sp.]|uniref:FAD-dependent oxidoreductase n=1 Tax=Armatimonas sp. TaxID=1872638 RepID=UPI0037510F36